jgi:hypothetical protein
MDLSHPIESVISSAHGPVLEVLASTEVALTGRGVAALLEGRVSSRRVIDVLNELVDAGVVLRDRIGAAYQFRLNREHLAAPAILRLAGLRSALIDAIGDAVASWALPPVAVWLFGSVARGNAGPASDVDLLVLRPTFVDEDDPIWAEQISDLEGRIGRWTGNQATAIEYGDDEFSALVQAGDRLVDALRTDAITIAGESAHARCRAVRTR